MVRVQRRIATTVLVILGALTAAPAFLALVQARPAIQPAPPSPKFARDAAERAQKRIEALHRESELLAGQEKSLLGGLRALEIERDLRLEEARQFDVQIQGVTGQIEEAGRQAAQLDATVDAMRPALNARLVEVYKLGTPGYARLLLGVGDLREIGRASRMVATLARMDQRRVEAFKSAAASLAENRKALEQQTSTLQELQSEARKAAALAAKAADARQQLVGRIDRQRDLNAQMVGELEAAALRLQRALQGLPAAPAGDLVVLPIKPFRGALDWPAAGRLSSRFGQARSGSPAAQNGIEIAAGEGQPVRAVHDGRVAYADVFAGLGQLVIVDHGGLAFSLYGHLGSMSVAKGAVVGHGEAIGTTGRGPAGNSAVYFELRIDGAPVDPLQWLKGGQ
jgi:septal ring factor EnvC (AmiA/AmiB activator)